MTVITSDQAPEWRLVADLEDARFELRRVQLNALYPHWTATKRQYLEAAERDARATVKAIREQLTALQAARAKLVTRPAPKVGEQLTLFDLPPLPANRGRRR